MSAAARPTPIEVREKMEHNCSVAMEDTATALDGFEMRPQQRRTVARMAAAHRLACDGSPLSDEELFDWYRLVETTDAPLLCDIASTARTCLRHLENTLHGSATSRLRHLIKSQCLLELIIGEAFQS